MKMTFSTMPQSNASQSELAPPKTAPSQTASSQTAEGKSVVNVVQTVHCPTCGSLAERRLMSSCQTSIGEYCIRTACPSCDYLLVSGSLTGRVLESYAPGQMRGR